MTREQVYGRRPVRETLRGPREVLELWATERALPSGVLAEQVHPKTGAPLSVSPLTWSHAEFVGTVHRLLEYLRHLRIGKSDTLPPSPDPQAGHILCETGASEPKHDELEPV